MEGNDPRVDARRLAESMVHLAHLELDRQDRPPAPENTNPKVFQCVSDYIDNRKTSTDTVSQIKKLVNDGELIDGYGAPDGSYVTTPLMAAVHFEKIDIKVVKALLDNGANVNVESGRKTLLMCAADNLAYMGQEIVKSILFNRPDVDIKLFDYDGKSILSYILSNYEKYVESVKENVYKLIKEDKKTVYEKYDKLLGDYKNITLDFIEKCLLDTKESAVCNYSKFLDDHIKEIRRDEISFNKTAWEPENRGTRQEKEKQMDMFVKAEAKKLVTELIDKILDHKDIVYIINQEWRSDRTILTCLALLLDYYNKDKDKSTMTLNLIKKCIEKGANVNRVLHKIFEFDNPLEILKIFDKNGGGVDVTARLICPRSARPNEIGGFTVPYDNFLTYTMIWREAKSSKDSFIKKNIPVLKFIVDKLDKLDYDKVVNCILSPNYYNTTSITAAMDIIKNDMDNIKNDEIVELKNFLEKYMQDERILRHGLKYAVKSDNLEAFNIANSIITITKITEGGSIDDGIKAINDLLEGMEIPYSIQQAIDFAPGGPGAKAAGFSYRNTEAQLQAAAKKQKTTKYGSSRRSYVKAPLAKTKKKPRRRSHKKKALA